MAVRKRFLGWNGPALPKLVDHLLRPEDGYADPPDLDLRGHRFVFPGGRPGRRFVELLAQEAEARGLRLTAPRAQPVGALPELLYRSESGRSPADEVLSRQLWARALQDVRRDRLRILVPDPPDDGDLPGWAGLADVVVELHRTVSREGLDFETVAQRCGEDLLFDDTGRWKVLVEVRRRYLQSLESLGREDRHEARMAALEGGRVEVDPTDPEAVEEIHLVGVVDMPGVAREMLHRVAGDGFPVTAWIKAPESMEDRFDDVGCVAPDAWTGVEIPVPDDVLVVVDDPADQAGATLRAIAELGGKRAPDEITVGVPDEDVVPWLERGFRRHDLPHRVAGGTPLDRTSPFRLLEAVADYLDGRRFADLAALLRHPAVGRRLDDGPVLEVADRYQSDHLPARIHSDMPRSRRRGGEDDGPSLHDLVERLHGPELLGPLADGEGKRERGGEGEGARLGGRGSETGDGPAGRTLSDWMPEIMALLRKSYGGDSLRRGKPEGRVLIETFEQVREVAEAFHRLPAEADHPCSATHAIRLLLGQLRSSGTPVPPEPDRAAMELLGWLELHLDDAPALIVTGFNEGFVPESLNAHPFLPNALRSELGLVDNRWRWARDAYLLTALLASRDTVRIVAGRTTASADPLRPSRLLLTVRGEPLARRVLGFVGSDRDPVPPVLPPGVQIAERSDFATPPETEIHLPEAPESFSVTEFRALLQDPYRWALERRLGLDALHDANRELDPLGFGTLAHDVLRDFARSDAAAEEDVRAVTRRLDRLLDSAAARRFGSGALPAVPLQIEQLRHRLHAFAAWQAARVAAGWRLLAAEIGTPKEGVPFDVDGRPIRIRGRIDRVEIHQETGTIAVFDYKTGDRVPDPDAAHRTRSGEWRDLQLPLYRHLLRHLRLPGEEPIVEEGTEPDVRLGYIRISKDPARVGAVLADWSEEELRSALERARQVVRRLRTEGVIAFDRDATRTTRWDPLGPLLGRGVLSPTSSEDEEEDG